MIPREIAVMCSFVRVLQWVNYSGSYGNVIERYSSISPINLNTVLFKTSMIIYYGDKQVK